MKSVAAVVLGLLCYVPLYGQDMDLSSFIGQSFKRFAPGITVSEARKAWVDLYKSPCSQEGDEIDCTVEVHLPAGVKSIWLRLNAKDVSERQLVIDLLPGAAKIERESEFVSNFPFEKGVRTDQGSVLKMIQMNVRYEPKPGEEYNGQYQFNYNDAGWITSINNFWSNIQCSH